MEKTRLYEPAGYTAPSYTNTVAIESALLEQRLKDAFAQTGKIPLSPFAQAIADRKASSSKPARTPA